MRSEADATLMNATEAAEFLRASRTKLRRLVQSGAIPAYKVGSTYVFFKRDLYAYVHSHAVVPRGAEDAALQP